MKTIINYLKKSILTCFFLLLMMGCAGNNASKSNSGFRTTTVSYYADKFDGKKTASGETYRHSRHTASNKTLAFGTQVEVININNNKSVIITINDRGPLKSSREFDLSQGAFKKIANLNDGIIKVKYKILK